MLNYFDNLELNNARYLYEAYINPTPENFEIVKDVIECYVEMTGELFSFEEFHILQEITGEDLPVLLDDVAVEGNDFLDLIESLYPNLESLHKDYINNECDGYNIRYYFDIMKKISPVEYEDVYLHD